MADFVSVRVCRVSCVECRLCVLQCSLMMTFRCGEQPQNVDGRPFGFIFKSRCQHQHADDTTQRLRPRHIRRDISCASAQFIVVVDVFVTSGFADLADPGVAKKIKQ